jgi:hypothetical protein
MEARSEQYQEELYKQPFEVGLYYKEVRMTSKNNEPYRFYYDLFSFNPPGICYIDCDQNNNLSIVSIKFEGFSRLDLKIFEEGNEASIARFLEKLESDLVLTEDSGELFHRVGAILRKCSYINARDR